MANRQTESPRSTFAAVDKWIESKPGLRIRSANESDLSTILSFIQKLAEYEKLAHEVVATEELLRDYLFDENPVAYVLIAEFEEKAVGFALFFLNFSTFLARPGIYLEDVFVDIEMRNIGIGKQLLITIAQIAEANQFGRFEWSVLDWNEPSIEFYKSLGAKPQDEWTVFRLDTHGIKALAAKD